MPAVVNVNKSVKMSKLKMSRAALRMKNEDMEILMMLEKIRGELDHLHNNFDEITEPILIDSCIYEIKSLHMKYQYYLKQCKERGLVADMP